MKTSKSIWIRRLKEVRWFSLISVAVFLIIWSTINFFAIVPVDLLPSPVDVWHAFVDVLYNGYRNVSLLQNISSSLLRCGAGFVLACLTGIPLGLAMGYWSKISAVFDIPVRFLRPLPPLSYLILLLIWFGTGNSSKIALLYLTAFPILVTSAQAGVRAVKLQKIQAAQSLGANKWQIFAYVILPSALPMVFTGARIAIAAAFSTVVAAEIMAATDGLGWMIFSASRFLRNDIIIMGILVLGALGYLLSKAILSLDRSIIHWRGME